MCVSFPHSIGVEFACFRLEGIRYICVKTHNMWLPYSMNLHFPLSFFLIPRKNPTFSLNNTHTIIVYTMQIGSLLKTKAHLGPFSVFVLINARQWQSNSKSIQSNNIHPMDFVTVFFQSSDAEACFD